MSLITKFLLLATLLFSASICIVADKQMNTPPGQTACAFTHCSLVDHGMAAVIAAVPMAQAGFVFVLAILAGLAVGIAVPRNLLQTSIFTQFWERPPRLYRLHAQYLF